MSIEMYAIVETGGKQYRVAPGDTILVERLAGEVGDGVELGRVLLVSEDGKTTVGHPYLEEARVRAIIAGHSKGRRVLVFDYKAKLHYRRKAGHRQVETRLRIEEIILEG